MKQEINVLMTKPEMEKIMEVAAEMGKLGKELSEMTKNIVNPFENLKISKPDIYNINTQAISKGTGANYRHLNIRSTENLEFIPTRIVRLEIDWEH
ncbi:hypothetical protein [Chryseobacterium rhizosphaerae]|uniref:Uncharacterized protein n=1 Tax=Chryseobacterium rhizosphaerae TaxID=395937 RepID=A0ABX9IJW3_9FLAO|nr:hypothetical protein [Chryseobacterium rhizosphaerae]REC74521.1 hypothetical protein DRF57_13580 [Chryseobacterium rhizosphaerae]GEN66003.1 hypothetical protein CRH01_05710 [Chryseobacterium rhizosphaerae]